MTDAGPVIYPTKDLERAKAVFTTLLGVDPYVDTPYYVGYRVGDRETGLNPHGHDEGMVGAVCYYDVRDVAASIDALVSAGASVLQEPRDVGAGLLVATVRDADKNIIGLRQVPSS